MGQPNLHFTIDYGWRLVLLLNPAFEDCGSLLPFVAVNRFPNSTNQSQHRKNENEDFECQNRHSVVPPGRVPLRFGALAMGGDIVGVLHGEYREGKP
jgi:hypothetical protein